MTTAHAVATELRKLADALDRKPDQPMYAPGVYLNHHRYQGSDAKDIFINVASILPRPLAKSDGFYNDEYVLTYETEAIRIVASIEKSQTCKLVKPAQPAEYECISMLSDEEEAEVSK